MNTNSTRPPNNNRGTTSTTTVPQAEPAPKIIRSLDPDPFEEKLDTRVGLVNPDRNHQVKCEECGRFLKSRKLRKIHVQCYHPMTAYQCPFHPNFIFYTMDDLVRHCKQNHLMCNQCNTMANNRTALELHFSKYHPKSPVPKVQPAATSSPVPGDKPEMEQVEPGEGMTRPNNNHNHNKPSSLPRRAWKTFALFGIQPRTSMSAHCVRRFVVP